MTRPAQDDHRLRLWHSNQVDPRAGGRKLTYFRVYSGTLEAGRYGLQHIQKF